VVWSNVESGVAIIDAETLEIVDANPGAVRMYGGDKSALIGKRCNAVMCPADICPVLELNQPVERVEKVFIKANSEIIPIIKSVAKIKHNGRLLLLESFTDISELKKSEEQFRHMGITDKTGLLHKDSLSQISYGIRTPLNAIIGMLRIAETTYNTEKLKSCLSTIEHSSLQLLSFINEMFGMSEIETEKIELKDDPMSIEDTLKKICNSANKQLEQRELKLNVFMEKNACVQFACDESKLSLVISNLVSNAIKFTPAGGEITITVKEKEHKDKSSILKFTISDTGIGMSEEQAEKLFNAGEQPAIDFTGRFEGASIGLAISNNIIEKMGGKIWAESKLGKGASFIFELELSRVGNIGVEDINAITDGVKILVASNDEKICEYFKSIISGHNIVTDTAESVRATLSKVKAAHNKKNFYDIIFLDYNLQKDDVFDLTQKTLERAEADTIIIMAPVFKWDKIDVRMRGEGINGLLPTPLFPSNIINCLRRKGKIEIKNSVASEMPIRNKFDFSDITLLHAEDVEIDREILKALLESTNVSIDAAENGLIALEMFKQNPEKYDAIIMDLHMPEMGGYEATKTIRSLGFSKAESIPIIAVTANAFPEDVEKCLEYGMNDHIAKPIDVATLIRTISEHTNKG